MIEKGNDPSQRIHGIGFGDMTRMKEEALELFDDSETMDKTALVKAWRAVDTMISGSKRSSQ